MGRFAGDGRSGRWEMSWLRVLEKAFEENDGELKIKSGMKKRKTKKKGNSEEMFYVLDEEKRRER
jgi:hypothetical protein